MALVKRNNSKLLNKVKMLLLDFLETQSLNELEELHAVEHSFSRDHKKVSLNYSQILAKNNDKLACQARGIILSKEDHSVILPEEIFGKAEIQAFPFTRFFNVEQGEAATINWDTAKVYDKLDGSLLILSFHPCSNSWELATRKVPEASSTINGSTFTFSELFKRTLQKVYNLNFDDWTKSLNQDTTYMFELMTPYNQNVVRHKVSNIVLLGARNKKTFQEIPLEMVDVSIEKVKAFLINSQEKAKEFVESRRAFDAEGVVVCDANFNRVKMKSIEYALAHKMIDKIAASPRNLMEAILLKTDDDLIAILSEQIQDDINKTKNKMFAYHSKLTSTYNQIISEVDINSPTKQKDFALKVNKTGLWAAPMFYMFRNNCSFDEFLEASKGEGYSNTFLDTILSVIEK